MVVVEPRLGVSCGGVGSHVHVKVSQAMQARYGDHTVHGPFKRCEPVVKLFVESLGAMPSEVGEEQTRACRALCQASYPEQLTSYGMECPFEPINFVCVCVCVCVAFLFVITHLSIVRFVTVRRAHVRLAKLVVGVVKAKGFPGSLPTVWAVLDSWHGPNGFGGTASWSFGVVVGFDVVVDVTCHWWSCIRCWRIG